MDEKNDLIWYFIGHQSASESDKNLTLLRKKGIFLLHNSSNNWIAKKGAIELETYFLLLRPSSVRHASSSQDECGQISFVAFCCSFKDVLQSAWKMNALVSCYGGD